MTDTKAKAGANRMAGATGATEASRAAGVAAKAEADRMERAAAASDAKAMAEVLRNMAGGSAEAFDLFYARYAPLVMRIALRMLGDRMEAEDLCHDVFIEALRRGGGYEPTKGSVEAWLAVLARSRCLDRLRKNRRVVAMEKPIEEMERAVALREAAAEEEAIRLLEREAVRDALAGLPSSQRQAVVASYYGNKSQREMAKDWQIPLGTVKSWMRYGLKHMRRQLLKRGWIADAGKEESL